MKKNKKLLIIISIVLVLGIGLVFVFTNEKEQTTLFCNGIQSDENARLENSILIEKTGDDIHIDYTGEIQFLINNETAYEVMSIYVENQVSKLKEKDGDIATLEKSENQITYKFDFNMNSLSEDKIEELLGIYSHDIEQLKKHFESGGLICEER